jgi:ABC-type uncharacterized transport system substrate-binding protein
LNDPPLVHHASRRRGGGVAVCGPRAATDGADDRLSQCRFSTNFARQLSAFHKGLGETGYVDGQNVVVEYRWAEGQNDRLPAMAADLVQRQVTVIAATSTPAALAAKAATATIPIVFELGSDPIQLGLVGSLSHPSGNVTGVTQLNVEIAPKRLELLHELLPAVRVIALLVNPAEAREVLAAARTYGLEVHVLNASSDSDFDSAFAKLVELRAGGLLIAGGPFFSSLYRPHS